MNALYRGARTLATVEHLGETFRVVRRRLSSGKPWRKYLALLHGDDLMSASTTAARDGHMITDPVEGAKFFKETLARTFADDNPASRIVFRDKIAEFKRRAAN